MKIINVGIAGYGYSAKTFHVPFLESNSNFKIEKIFTRKEILCEIEQGKCEIVRSYEELLSNNIDLIIICTPNVEHFNMAKKALFANKHVIVEKPFTITVEEAQELKSIAEQNKLFISAFQNRRFDGDFLTVKKIISLGILGKVSNYECHFDRFVIGKNQKQWKNEKVRGVNILYDLGSHLIDQAIDVFGPPYEVYADFQKYRDESALFDDFKVVLYYADKRIVLSAGERVLRSGPHFIIHGDKGSFIKDGMDRQEENLAKGCNPKTELWGEDLYENYGILYTTFENDIIGEKVKTVRGNYGLFYENVYDVLCNNVKQLVPLEDTIMVQKILELAEKSNEMKRRMLYVEK